MCTIAIEALTPLDRTSRIKLYKNIARSRLFCRIAKRSIGGFIERGAYFKFCLRGEEFIREGDLIGMVAQ